MRLSSSRTFCSELPETEASRFTYGKNSPSISESDIPQMLLYLSFKEISVNWFKSLKMLTLLNFVTPVNMQNRRYASIFFKTPKTPLKTALFFSSISALSFIVSRSGLSYSSTRTTTRLPVFSLAAFITFSKRTAAVSEIQSQPYSFSQVRR